MAHKTFISYKHSDAVDSRDRIIEHLGKNEPFYRGETPSSPDISDNKMETIKNHLADMIFDTTVTIVILSPEVIKSKWVKWEVEYSLRNKNRSGLHRYPNQLIFIAQKHNNSYSWIEKDSFVGAYMLTEIQKYFGLKIDYDDIYTEEIFISSAPALIDYIYAYGKTYELLKL